MNSTWTTHQTRSPMNATSHSIARSTAGGTSRIPSVNKTMSDGVEPRTAKNSAFLAKR